MLEPVFFVFGRFFCTPMGRRQTRPARIIHGFNDVPCAGDGDPTLESKGLLPVEFDRNIYTVAFIRFPGFHFSVQYTGFRKTIDNALHATWESLQFSFVKLGNSPRNAK